MQQENDAARGGPRPVMQLPPAAAWRVNDTATTRGRELRRSVGAASIRDDDFVHFGNMSRAHNRFGQVGGLVQSGNDHGDSAACLTGTIFSVRQGHVQFTAEAAADASVVKMVPLKEEVGFGKQSGSLRKRRHGNPGRS